jgi:uncharacterized protein (TIGR02246 family)
MSFRLPVPQSPIESENAMTASTSATPSTDAGQEPAAGSSSAAAEQAAIAAVPARMVAAWAAHDADAFAELFTEDGTMILPGVYRKGRDDIRDYMAAEYAGAYQGTTVTGTPIEIQPLQPGAVALITQGGVIPAGETELPDATAIRASWILVKRDERWQLAVYQNCPRDPAA